MRTLLLVGIGRAGVPFLESGRRLGFAVHAVELAEREAAYAEGVAGFTACRGLSDELWAEGAAAAARLGRPDGVLAFNEPHVLGAALVQEELGLPGPSLPAAVISRNKALQRGRFAAAGIRQPEYAVVDDPHDAREWAARRYPVVVKPLSATGSAGVMQVTSQEELSRLLDRRRGERLLVEAAAEGPEYSWEAVVIDGDVRLANVSAKETTGPPQFVEVVHRAAAELSPAVRREIDAFGASVLAAISMRTGVVHLEFRLTAQGPSVIEIAVRMPGDGLMELMELTYGQNWYDLLVLAAMGRELPELTPEPRQFAASYLVPTGGGTVTEIRGLDEARSHPHVVRADVMVKPGDRVPATTSSLERVGGFLFCAPTRGELEAAISYVRDAFRVATITA